MIDQHWTRAFGYNMHSSNLNYTVILIKLQIVENVVSVFCYSRTILVKLLICTIILLKILAGVLCPVLLVFYFSTLYIFQEHVKDIILSY